MRQALHNSIANPGQRDLVVRLQRATGHHADRPPTALFWKILHAYFEAVSVTATGVVFILLFPFWWALGLPDVTVTLCVLMSLAQLVTSWIKDLIWLGRPPYPPVIRTGGDQYKAEYSFPSGHSSGAVLLSYVNARFAIQHFGANPQVAIALGVFYTSQVAFSRVYLGMHWLYDVVAGLSIGGALVAGHVVLGGEAILGWVFNAPSDMQQFPFVAAGVVLVCFLVIRLHPTPGVPCPCILDSARFAGATLGAVLGAWCVFFRGGMLLRDSAHVWSNTPSAPISWLGVLMRTVTMMIGMVVTEMVVKPIAEVVLKYVCFIPLVRRIFVDTASVTSTLKEHWPAHYIWARWLSHVAFSFALLFGGTLYCHLLPL